MRKPSTFVVAIFVSIVSVQATGCTFIGGIIGGAWPEPQMESDLNSFPGGTEIVLNFKDQSWQIATFLRVEQLTDAAYEAVLQERSQQEPLLANLPRMGDSLSVFFQNDTLAHQGRFSGFVGYKSLRLQLDFGEESYQAWPLDLIESVANQNGASVLGAHFVSLARTDALPSRTVIIVERDAGEETIYADELLEIEENVASKQALTGLAIGLAVDITIIALVLYLCRDDRCNFQYE